MHLGEKNNGAHSGCTSLNIMHLAAKKRKKHFGALACFLATGGRGCPLDIEFDFCTAAGPGSIPGSTCLALPYT